MGRDELGDFYVEELEELALDPDEEPTLHHGAADPTVTGPTGRVSGLAARAPQAKTAQDLVKEAFRAQKAEEDRQAQAALEAKRRVAAEAKARVVAAQRAGVTLDIARMDARVEALRARGPMVVEGVGGALVEVVPGVAVADLGARWDLDVLIVAGNRLGVLNHTLLTVEAVAARGARIAGVVLNTVHPGEPTVAERTNAAELARLLPASAPLLGAMPFVHEATAASLAQAGEELTARLLPFLR